MKIEEYLETLPKNLLSGEDVQLPEKSLREIFKFSNLGKNDIFFHLGCNNEKGIEIAINEFKVKKAIGIDNNFKKIQNAQKNIEEKNINVKMIHQNIEESDISDATVILFWFTDENIINKMIKKFEKLKPETKIITIWGPLPNYLPDKVSFPYIINKVPFKKSRKFARTVVSSFWCKMYRFLLLRGNLQKDILNQFLD